jgi:hypothetical protein
MLAPGGHKNRKPRNAQSNQTAALALPATQADADLLARADAGAGQALRKRALPGGQGDKRNTSDQTACSFVLHTTHQETRPAIHRSIRAMRPKPQTSDLLAAVQPAAPCAHLSVILPRAASAFCIRWVLLRPSQDGGISNRLTCKLPRCPAPMRASPGPVLPRAPHHRAPHHRAPHRVRSCEIQEY